MTTGTTGAGIPPAPLLEIRDAHRRYGDVVALRGVSFSLAAGRILALLGPNGSGKTTLMSIIAGLRSPDAGEVLVQGLDTTRHRPGARGAVGYAPQELGVYPVLTVQENLSFFAAVAGVPGRSRAAEIAEAAELFALTGLMNRLVRSLSGGEQRRVHAAGALLGRPALLLLDEPTAGVDVETRTTVLQGVRTLADGGTGIVYATHHLGELDALDPDVVILREGRVVAEGSMAQLLERAGDDVVELCFDGPVPLPVMPPGVRCDVLADRLVLRGGVDGRTLLAVLDALRGDIDRLTTMERRRASLEHIYLNSADPPLSDLEEAVRARA